jgi:hypothetical protein
MAKGRPLSAAHKAAISAGLKRYWANKKGSGSGGGSGQRSGGHIQSLVGGKVGTISREDAARIMFGSKGAAKKLAAGKKAKRR